jgi:hypothetical protein
MTEVKDFFISYTGADIAWAEWIAQTLEDAGYTTVLQAWDFRPGDNFIQRMDQALAEANRVLAVLSPAYFASEYARDEWTAALVRARGERDRLLPVRIAACQLPPVLANRVYVDLVDLDEPAVEAGLLDGVQPGRAKPKGKLSFPGGQAKPELVSFPGRSPKIFEVPPRNRHFTGRGDLLQALRDRLAATSSGAVVQAEAIHGLGGIGKTQLAIEYAHRYAADYDLIWWITAEQPVTIPGQLTRLARRLDLPELSGLEDQVAALFEELRQRDRWLLLYDNAEDPASLASVRPPAGTGHLLVTSRNPAWGEIAATLRLDVLTRDQAVALLRQRLGRNDPAFEQLAEVLGDLPLALAQAAAYLEATCTPPGEYLSLLGERLGELLAQGQPSDYPATVATTWSVTLDRLRGEAPAALDPLALCAFLGPDDILAVCSPTILTCCPAGLA